MNEALVAAYTPYAATTSVAMNASLRLAVGQIDRCHTCSAWHHENDLHPPYQLQGVTPSDLFLQRD